MKILVVFLLSFLGTPQKSVHDFKFTSIDGKEISLKKFQGKKILIVNTASKCGFTPQYADLEELSKQYKSKLVVIGFPANNFGDQEPEGNSSIREFCQENYGVTFLMAEKVSVKGADQDPLFKYLTAAENPDFKGDIIWNFEKFLVDENGKLVRRFRSNVNPMSQEIIKAIAE